MASSQPLSRRVFLTSTVGGLALACLEPTPAKARIPSFDDRITLAEPGPMLPPVPALWLTVNGMTGDPDEISVVWSFVVNGKPPQVGVSVHHEHVAQKLIDHHGDFVLNLPVVDLVEAFDRVDMNSSRVGDKYELSGLTRGQAAVVDAPTVAEAPIHVECRVFNTLDVPPMRKLFLAEVMATTVPEGVCDDAGRLLVPAVPFFGMTAGSGEFYTMGQRVGHIGQTAGRSDIKY